MSTTNFSITGEFITNHFRSLLLERNIDKAVNGLLESIIGLPKNLALNVLIGNGEFEGKDETLGYIEKESTEHKNEMLKMGVTFDIIEGEIELKLLNRHARNLKRDQSEIVEQAKTTGGFLELRERDGTLVCTVPKHPFIRWALRGSGMRTYSDYPWNNICGHHAKMENDDPNHTDWMVGAGLDYLNEEHYGGESKFQRIAYKESRRLQRTLLGFDSLVLANGGEVIGDIVHVRTASDVEKVNDGDIIVIPNAGVDFEMAFLVATRSKCGGVITQIPNKVAHLCKIAREHNVTIMCDEKAFDKFEEKCTVSLNPNNGTIQILHMGTETTFDIKNKKKLDFINDYVNRNNKA